MVAQDLLSETGEFWSSIDSYRQRRTADVDAVLTKVLAMPALSDFDELGDSNLAYAVRYHLLGILESLAADGDLSLVVDAVTPTLEKVVADSHQVKARTRVVCARATEADLTRDETVSATPYAFLSETILDQAQGAEIAAISEAFALAAAAGFGNLLAQNAKVVVLLRPRNVGDTVESYTTNRLPGTVFTDFYSEPWLLARDLVHEASHTALNDALAARGERLPDDVTYYSPWKQTDRPVHGFLHAVWAFSHVTLYSRWLMTNDNVPHEVRSLSAVLAKSYSRDLASVGTDLPSALDWLSSSVVADSIRNAWRRATADAD